MIPNLSDTTHRDDWREETLARLQKSMLYATLERKCASDPAGANVVALVQEAVHYSYNRTRAVLRHMGEFTLHDGDHPFRILLLMERLQEKAAIDALTVPELMLLILSAFFHDIGMAPAESAVVAWKKIWDKAPILQGGADSEEYEKFLRYCKARPNETNQIDTLTSQGDFSAADLLKNYLVADYIRATHAERCSEIIEQDWTEKLLYRDTDLTVEFAAICHSHNQDPQVLMEMERDYLCGPGTFCCLPFVGILLRLADILDFDSKRTPSVLFSHLFVRHPVSISEWNKHRSVEAWNISTDVIQFSAKCGHPAIEAAIHDFCDLIDRELSQCSNLSVSLNEFLRAHNRGITIRIPYKVDRSKIATKKNINGDPKYLYRRTEFTLSKTQVIDLLMGTKLYGNPQVALRELIQNSIDACLLRRALEKSWNNEYNPEISIRYYSEGNEEVLEVIDNGTGMDQHIIDKFYTKVGSSFYKSTEFFDLKSQANAHFVPTSRFGIGILSAFMVADTLVVDTRRVYAPHDSSDPLNLTVEGQESIFWIKKGTRKTPGTTTKLVLRGTNNPWRTMDGSQFIESVESVIPNPPFRVTITSNKKTKTRNESSFKLLSAKSLKNHSWNSSDNIREMEFSFEDESLGFVGSVVIAVLESNGLPVASIDMTSRSVTIDHVDYTLDKSMTMAGDSISVSSSSITVDDQGNVDQSSSSSEVASSKSRISLHGIEIPTNLFPDYWERRQNPVRLDWPFPALLILDVCGEADLDLNSSRTHILQSEKWIDFEAVLTTAVCQRISQAVSEEYWTTLISVLTEVSDNETFIQCLNTVSRPPV